MVNESQLLVERVQTGVRIEKRLLKVLKALAEYHDMSLGDLLEGIVLHAFDGKTPFRPSSLKRIQELKRFYASISIPEPATGSPKSKGARGTRLPRRRKNDTNDTRDRLPMRFEAIMTGDELIKQFEDGTTPRGTFHHADHVRLAFEYLDRYPALEALEKFSAALKRFAAAARKTAALPRDHHLGLPASDSRAHGPCRRAQTWEEFAERNPDLLIWKGGVLGTLYRQETLDSDLARHTFVLPDQGL